MAATIDATIIYLTEKDEVTTEKASMYFINQINNYQKQHGLCRVFMRWPKDANLSELTRQGWKSNLPVEELPKPLRMALLIGAL
jgi:hypothetical protein